MSLTAPPPAEPTDAVLDAAAGWRMRMDEPGWSFADEQALEAWLAQDETHAEAFARTGQVWDFFEEHAAAPEMMRARRDAIDRAQRKAAGPGWLLRAPAPARIAAGIAAAVVLGAGVYPLVDGKDVYRTDLGERPVIRSGSSTPGGCCLRFAFPASPISVATCSVARLEGPAWATVSAAGRCTFVASVPANTATLVSVRGCHASHA